MVVVILTTIRVSLLP